MARLRNESGFGMLELLIAMVVLNVGLFALVGTFNASTVAIKRAGDRSAATAVADKQMEIYRGLGNCAIWLDQWLMPAVGSQYALDTTSYNGSASSSPKISYWSTGTAADSQYWATDGMDSSNFLSQINLASCAWKAQGAANQLTLPLTATQGANNATTGIDSLGLVTPYSSATISAVKPVQTIIGPNGLNYTVYTYIVLVQPTSGEYAKQVTVVVYDPRNSTHVLARETSVFDPTTSP
ncbi:MAG TPA: type II secretion system protein [Gaiellaceae bacterium]|nr:type II secretion system protein [Gaiellaceae bacterium]